MIKLSQIDYRDLLKSLKESESIYKYNLLMPTNSKYNFSNQNFTTSKALFKFSKYLVNDTIKANNSYSFSNYIGAKALYNLWGIITDLNLKDDTDYYLPLNLELHKLWLNIEKQATISMKQFYMNTIHCNRPMLNYIINKFAEDTKTMIYEKQSYWKNVRKYSWNNLCLSSSKDHIAYIDKVNSHEQIIKAHYLPND